MAADGPLDSSMVKTVAFFLLTALDFLHSKANIVHAGIVFTSLLFGRVLTRLQISMRVT